MFRVFIFVFLLLSKISLAYIFIPMDLTQKNHLKAYGLVYFALTEGVEVKWLLNYKGGSFLIDSDSKIFQVWALSRGVKIEKIGENEWEKIQEVIANGNMAIVRLTKAPRIAVYAPPWNEEWDDAVRMALSYAEIPYTVIYDEDILSGRLTPDNFDWLHLHHEDFTGQFGKFGSFYKGVPWYDMLVKNENELAHKLGFKSVAELKKVVANKIREYVMKGGFLFAMCAATDTLDIALASKDVDIVPPVFDGTPITPDAQTKLDFSRTFAFENFHIVFNPNIYEFSDIDISPSAEGIYRTINRFELFDFSAKIDPVPTMLNQNHTRVIKDFLGQTTGFKKKFLKKNITVLGQTPGADWVKYIRGDLGKGAFAFLGGHDPEDYVHYVGDPPTDLSLYPNSPGYRLILNNVLFPAANKKKRKT